VEEEGLLARLRVSVGVFVDRLRTSSRFRIATVSVVAHAALLVWVSFYVIPSVTKPEPGTIVVEMEPDRVVTRSGSDGAPPVPNVAPDGDLEPETFVRDDFRVTVRPDGEEINIGAIVPPDHPVVSARMRGIFACYLPAHAKERRLSAAFADPKPVIAGLSRALAWLAKTQRDDGSWASSPRNPEHGTGVTAAVLLAFLSDGHSELRGNYRNVVTKAVDRLLADQKRTGELLGLIGEPEEKYAYNHALATMALIETYCQDYRGESQERTLALRQAIVRGLKFIERSQMESGGWKYDAPFIPGSQYEEDTSVSLFMVMALASARSARFELPGKEAAIDGFTKWLTRVTGEDGVVGYHRTGDRDDYPRTLTAGALFVEELLGLQTRLRDRQAALVRKDIAAPGDPAARNALLRLFAALAFRTRGEPVLRRLGPPLVESQSKQGSWTVESEEDDLYAVHGGEAFLTAVNVLTITSAYRAY
jgi:hypothetical protein